MTQLMLRNSERTTFKTCRFRWALTYAGLLQAGPVRSREPAKALWFGDLIHQGLARYYKKGTERGTHPAKTFLRLYDADERVSAVQRNDQGEWESMRDLGRGMLESYVEQFAERDQEWEVLSSERTFRLPVEIPRWQAGDLGYFPPFTIYVVGTFDGVWRSRRKRSRVVFSEFKTASQITTDGLALDDQAGFYWTYGPRYLRKNDIIKKGAMPSEILYSYLRKAIRNPDFDYDEQGRKLNQDGSVSKSQPAPFFHREPVYRDEADRRNLHERVLSEAREMQLARSGLLTPIKNPGPLHNPNCRGCPVREPCELHETGADWEAMLRATTESWDPYAAHEIVERR